MIECTPEDVSGTGAQIVATHEGFSGLWEPAPEAFGTVQVDVPAPGKVTITDNQTVGTQPQRFLWLEVQKIP